MTDQPPISQILASLTAAEDTDVSFIIAACINLYIEARRRMEGRVLLSASDIKPLFDLCSGLLATPAKPDLPRSRKLTEEESAGVLEAVESKIGRRV